MTTVIDKEDKTSNDSSGRNTVQTIINVYAALMTVLLLIFLLSLNIKDQPTPLDRTDINQIQESYSMLAGICVTVGECGNDQVVVGLEKNRSSELFYHVLLWKKNLKKNQ